MLLLVMYIVLACGDSTPVAKEANQEQIQSILHQREQNEYLRGREILEWVGRDPDYWAIARVLDGRPECEHFIFIPSPPTESPGLVLSWKNCGNNEGSSPEILYSVRWERMGVEDEATIERIKRAAYNNIDNNTDVPKSEISSSSRSNGAVEEAIHKYNECLRKEISRAKQLYKSEEWYVSRIYESKNNFMITLTFKPDSCRSDEPTPGTYVGKVGHAFHNLSVDKEKLYYKLPD